MSGHPTGVHELHVPEGIISRFWQMSRKNFELLECGGVLGVLKSFVKERISKRLPNIVFSIDIGNIL